MNENDLLTEMRKAHPEWEFQYSINSDAIAIKRDIAIGHSYFMIALIPNGFNEIYIYNRSACPTELTPNQARTLATGLVIAAELAVRLEGVRE